MVAKFNNGHVQQSFTPSYHYSAKVWNPHIGFIFLRNIKIDIVESPFAFYFDHYHFKLVPKQMDDSLKQMLFHFLHERISYPWP
jgi:hypothetical protein